jgi:hypothetical protein
MCWALGTLWKKRVPELKCPIDITLDAPAVREGSRAATALRKHATRPEEKGTTCSCNLVILQTQLTSLTGRGCGRAIVEAILARIARHACGNVLAAQHAQADYIIPRSSSITVYSLRASCATMLLTYPATLSATGTPCLIQNPCGQPSLSSISITGFHESSPMPSTSSTSPQLNLPLVLISASLVSSATQ